MLAVLGGSAVTAEAKYAVQVPDGLAFSEFRGYETWQVVSVSKTDELFNVIGCGLAALCSSLLRFVQ